MSLAMTILGYLSRHQGSGYDIKKQIASSALLPWTANNNQIYKTLLELEHQGLSTATVQASTEGPARKVYAITAKGRDTLRAWLADCPEPLDPENPLILRLVACQDDPVLMMPMVRAYEEKLHDVLLMVRSRGADPAIDLEESLAGELAQDYRESMLQAEHEWCRRLRHRLEKEGALA